MAELRKRGGGRRRRWTGGERVGEGRKMRSVGRKGGASKNYALKCMRKMGRYNEQT